MKRTQQFGRYIRGKVGIRKEMKKAQTKAERIELKRLLKLKPEEAETKLKRRYWGYDD
jgi:hypothetical protein